MTTYWTNGPVTFGADEPLPAHITRKLLQDNLQTVYGDSTYPNSGYDYDFRIFNDAEISSATTSTWAWVDDWAPQPFPVFPTQGGGWRDYYVEVDSKGTATTTLRVYLVQWSMPPTLDASGLIEGVDSYDDITCPVGYSTPRSGVTIELGDITSVMAAGQQNPIVWIHMAAVVLPAGPGTVEIRAVRVRELE